MHCLALLDYIAATTESLETEQGCLGTYSGKITCLRPNGLSPRHAVPANKYFGEGYDVSCCPSLKSQTNKKSYAAIAVSMCGCGKGGGVVILYINKAMERKTLNVEISKGGETVLKMPR